MSDLAEQTLQPDKSHVVKQMICKLQSIARYFHAFRMRRAAEKAAYWKAKADALRMLLESRRYSSYERSYFVDAVARHKMYEARLDSLMSDSESGGSEHDCGAECQSSVKSRDASEPHPL